MVTPSAVVMSVCRRVAVDSVFTRTGAADQGFIDFGDKRVVAQDMNDDAEHAPFRLESGASGVAETRPSRLPRYAIPRCRSGVATQGAPRTIASFMCPSAASWVRIPAPVAISNVESATTSVLAIRAGSVTSQITLRVSGVTGIDRSGIPDEYQQVQPSCRGCSQGLREATPPGEGAIPLQMTALSSEAKRIRSLSACGRFHTGPGTRRRERGRPSAKRRLTTTPSSEAVSMESVPATDVARTG